MTLSVLICAHNPRVDYLDRVLQALKAQDLPPSEWELLLIDNASSVPLRKTCDLSWHPYARCIIENEVGLTHARLRAIREAQAEILVFVDDDNVVAPDYLAECARISEKWPSLGAWGGQLLPEFEGGEPQEKWKREFWTIQLEKEIWSNNYDRETAPVGAGLCIRRAVASQYTKLAATHSLRLNLGRRGAGVDSAAEDIDMTFTACDMGLGIGRFASLRLVHLIPRQRLADDYLFRLIEGCAYSETIVVALRRGIPANRCRIDRLVDFYKSLRTPKLQRRMARAAAQGRARALDDLLDSRSVSSF